MNQQCAGAVVVLRWFLLHLSVHWVHLGDLTLSNIMDWSEKKESSHWVHRCSDR